MDKLTTMVENILHDKGYLESEKYDHQEWELEGLADTMHTNHVSVRQLSRLITVNSHRSHIAPVTDHLT